MDKKWHKRQKRVFEILEVGNDLDNVSRVYDYVNASAIILNLVISILYTYAELREIWWNIPSFGRNNSCVFLY